jgi:hypothetical protein
MTERTVPSCIRAILDVILRERNDRRIFSPGTSKDSSATPQNLHGYKPTTMNENTSLGVGEALASHRKLKLPLLLR